MVSGACALYGLLKGQRTSRSSITTDSWKRFNLSLQPVERPAVLIDDLFAYQSSFTAMTASRPAAARPASHAVTVPASTTAAASAPSRPTGTRSSIVQ